MSKKGLYQFKVRFHSVVAVCVLFCFYLGQRHNSKD